MRLTLIGQSTVIIETSGLVIMTDPWWGRYEFLRAVPLGLDPESLQRVDLMLVSHNHVDHWSNPAIALAARLGTHVVASVRAARRAVKRGLSNVVEMRPGDIHHFGGLKIHAVPAFHPFARDAVGFVVENEATIYFSGDTLYDRRLAEALRPFEIDIAMVQTACSTYPLVGKDGMDLEAAARFAEEVKPRILVPIHFQVKGKVIEPAVLREWDAPVDVLVLEPGLGSGLEL